MSPSSRNKPLFLLILLVIPLLLFSCDTAPLVVRLSDEQLVMTIGEVHRIIATVEPANAADNTVIWSIVSNGLNNNVVSIEKDGTVTAMSEGFVYVVASCGDVSTMCGITVNSAAASGSHEGTTAENW